MSEKKWTSGPWSVFDDDGAYIIEIQEGYSIGVAYNNDDAHLIAAAPELYEALEAAVQYGCPVCGGDCSAANPPVASCPMSTALAALAKARGEA